jgi:hypothetical protein
MLRRERLSELIYDQLNCYHQAVGGGRSRESISSKLHNGLLWLYPGSKKSLLTALQLILLLTILLVPLLLMQEKSATYDEVAHLPAGYSYLTTGVVQLNQQHPPLIKEICALPLVLLDVKTWPNSLGREQVEADPSYQWTYGREFLYSQDADQLLWWGRMPAVFLSLGLAVLVMLWAHHLWGKTASLLALALYAVDPTITAHAQLVTTDVGFAFTATLFLYLLRSYLENPSGQGLIVTGLSLGLALGAKFSAVVLIPIAGLFMLIAAWTGQRLKGFKRGRVIQAREVEQGTKLTAVGLQTKDVLTFRIISAVVSLSIMVGLATALLWVIYLFPTDPLFYLRGLRTVGQDHDPKFLYYLMGELREGGWRTYLLITWLVKTPIPFLLLLAGSLVLFLRGHRTAWLDEAFLIIPPLALFICYSLTADNMGVRYLIPCFPFLFIFTARIASYPFTARPIYVGGLTALLGWCLFEFLAIMPDHLSYFNQLAGGSRHGFEWLDDSNVDWGQGLIQLKDYLRDHPVGDYWVCYFGSGDPSYYGIKGRRITDLGSIIRPPQGTIILSSHCLARGQAMMARLFGRGPENWLAHAVPKAIVGHAYYIYQIP